MDTPKQLLYELINQTSWFFAGGSSERNAIEALKKRDLTRLHDLLSEELKVAFSPDEVIRIVKSQEEGSRSDAEDKTSKKFARAKMARELLDAWHQFKEIALDLARGMTTDELSFVIPIDDPRRQPQGGPSDSGSKDH